MVRIEKDRVTIEVPCASRVDGLEYWEGLTRSLLDLVQVTSGEILADDDRCNIVELLRAMLPRFTSDAGDAGKL